MELKRLRRTIWAVSFSTREWFSGGLFIVFFFSVMFVALHLLSSWVHLTGFLIKADPRDGPNWCFGPRSVHHEIECHQFARTSIRPGRTVLLAVQIFAEAFPSAGPRYQAEWSGNANNVWVEPGPIAPIGTVCLFQSARWSLSITHSG